ncbi:MAG: 16S rRNA (cytidine1402-2'-O)-methyltransferase [bacterium P3]|nr:MAG: 16S rRNA (cytidine1402-2'-O)-methyltransferase [bacterium P3]KWW42002.1 MAG: 16S rRNA (cytidine1402-2'-O)-methyltransferase [bacterium F083]
MILFPVPIGCEDLCRSLPGWNLQQLEGCRHFIVEEIRTARRFLRHAGYRHPLDEDFFYLLNEHTASSWRSGTGTADFESWIARIGDGEDVGVLSEAGLPCVADPGALAVKWAHEHNVEVVPLVGPSSLMLALMASGLDGQNFVFNGYLPVDAAQRAKRIHELERRMRSEHQTQLFIEAPYRNNQLLDALCSLLQSETRLCVACDLTLPSQLIRTLPAGRWKSERSKTDLHKRNTVFLFGE